MDVFNCQQVLFTHSSLEHNRGTGIANTTFRGNTGGACFGYNTLPNGFSSLSLNVSNCTFYNNSATAESVFRTSSRAFADSVFSGRGGALAVFSNASNGNLLVNISNCTFQKNYARSFGGALYLLLGGYITDHELVVERSQFDSNIGRLGGGGVQVTYYSHRPQVKHILIRLSHCQITNNKGRAGGGIFVIPSSFGMLYY